jgi:type IV pilus assembly protein PilE
MLAARGYKGFTLIELLVVVGIVAIIAALGYPSYQESVRKSARTEARSALAAAASSMERLKAVSMSYAGATVGSGGTDTMPNRTPDSGTIKYNLSLAATPTATTYTLKAASTDAQDSDSGSVEIMMINQAGQTCISTESASTADCTFGTDPAW